MQSALKALDDLIKGNQRFVSGIRRRNSLPNKIRRRRLVAGQEPFAIILGCSDSRVPAEIIFDQGLGDLFVIRVAGNVAAPSQIGSVEFAVELFGTRLVIVLGHSECGAVIATLAELKQPKASRSPNLRAIVDRIRPAVKSLGKGHPENMPIDIVQQAVRANVRKAAKDLRKGSPILERLIQSDELMVVGAEYLLHSGVVDFFDGQQQSG